jgi:hypothetical protein
MAKVNYKKLLPNLILSILIIYLMNFVVYADIEKVKKSRKSVIRVLNPVNSKGFAMGSGFAIGKRGEKVQYFVTCYHIFEDDIGEIKIVNGNNKIDAKLYKYNTKKDIAILKVDKSIDSIEPLVLANMNEIEITDNVYSLGFPGILDDLSDIDYNSFTAYENEVAVGTGTINKIYDNDENNNMIVHDAKISEGNSGGPLINEDGEVLGINVFLNVTESNVVYGQTVTTSEIIKILNLNDIVYEKAEELDEDDSLKLQTDSNKEIMTTVDDIKEDNEIDEENENFIVYLKNNLGDGKFIVGGMIFTLLLIVIVIILVSTGKKSSKSLKNMNNDFISNNTNSPYIKALFKSDLNLVSMENGSVKFGRDKSICTFVFKENQTDISSIHCEVFWNKNLNKIYIVDKSKNGTFLENGVRIEKENIYELNVNDKFYLSDPSNMFKIIFQ